MLMGTHAYARISLIMQFWTKRYNYLYWKFHQKWAIITSKEHLSPISFTTCVSLVIFVNITAEKKISACFYPHLIQSQTRHKKCGLKNKQGKDTKCCIDTKSTESWDNLKKRIKSLFLHIYIYYKTIFWIIL